MSFPDGVSDTIASGNLFLLYVLQLREDYKGIRQGVVGKCGVLHFRIDFGDLSSTICVVYRQNEFHVPAEYSCDVFDDFCLGVYAEMPVKTVLPDIQWRGYRGEEAV